VQSGWFGWVTARYAACRCTISSPADQELKDRNYPSRTKYALRADLLDNLSPILGEALRLDILEFEQILRYLAGRVGEERLLAEAEAVAHDQGGAFERRGREKGKVEGRAEGKAELLIRILERRFGAIST
jgi:hypothetical protein